MSAPRRAGVRRQVPIDASGGRPRPADGPRLLEPRLVVLFLVGCVLFGYPGPGGVAPASTPGGVPAFFLYLFGSWALFVGVLAWLFERRQRSRRPPEPPRDVTP